MKKTHKILIPNMAVTQFRLLQYALQYDCLLYTSVFQHGKKRIVVCAVIDTDLKALFRPLNARRLMQGKTAAVTPSKITDVYKRQG